MNAPVSATLFTPHRHTRCGLTTWGLGILGILICCLAITNRSYWIDEAESAYKASLPTVTAWWNRLRIEGSGNLQLPLYHIFAWGWEKVVGLNEFAMRAGSIPWFILGLLVFTKTFTSCAGPPTEAFAKSECLWKTGTFCCAIVPLLSPFTWYYLNEARPYAMQIGLSMLVLGSLYRLASGQAGSSQNERFWVLGLCASSVLLAASGLLAMIWAGAYLGAAVLSTGKQQARKLIGLYWKEGISTLLLFFCVGIFYLWTLHIGARATAVGKTDFRNLLFIPYELLGFSGLGPGRLDIRAGAGSVAVFRPFAFWLAVYGVSVAILLAEGCRELRLSFPLRTVFVWAAAFLAAGGFILVVGVTVDFRVLGRHWTPVLPLCLYILAKGILGLLRRGGWLRAFVVLSFFAFSLTSCLLLRFSDRHLKDDYRTAAQIGREALGRVQRVWWNADAEGALVYKLPVADHIGVPKAAFTFANPVHDFAGELPLPDLVLTSKPDIYDSAGALREYLIRNGFQPVATPTAFIAWRRSAK